MIVKSAEDVILILLGLLFWIMLIMLPFIVGEM
jgi:hypothetical protein